jgi:hypothetical protein
MPVTSAAPRFDAARGMIVYPELDLRKNGVKYNVSANDVNPWLYSGSMNPIFCRVKKEVV